MTYIASEMTAAWNGQHGLNDVRSGLSSSTDQQAAEALYSRHAVMWGLQQLVYRVRLTEYASTTSILYTCQPYCSVFLYFSC